jgi:S-adenosylmethionine hydrolase
MARSQFSFEKRRKELEKKKKKKDAKRQAKADRKASGEEIPEPVVTIDEFGNVVATMPDDESEDETEA